MLARSCMVAAMGIRIVLLLNRRAISVRGETDSGVWEGKCTLGKLARVVFVGPDGKKGQFQHQGWPMQQSKLLQSQPARLL